MQSSGFLRGPNGRLMEVILGFESDTELPNIIRTNVEKLEQNGYLITEISKMGKEIWIKMCDKPKDVEFTPVPDDALDGNIPFKRPHMFTRKIYVFDPSELQGVPDESLIRTTSFTPKDI